MKKITTIYNSRNIRTLVLFSYAFLYLCIAFHFHPVNLIFGNDNFEIKAENDSNSNDHSQILCEICHIKTTLFAEVDTNYKIESSDKPQILLQSVETQFTSNNLTLLPFLRAPPAA